MSKKNRPHTPKKFRQPRSRKSDHVEDGLGPPCPRCSQTTKRWRWSDYQARAAATGTFVYKWWYSCTNRRCSTKQIMPQGGHLRPAAVPALRGTSWPGAGRHHLRATTSGAALRLNQSGLTPLVRLSRTGCRRRCPEIRTS